MSELAEILTVDDMPANLEVLTETLTSAGYSVAATTSGERALKRLQNYLPDLILLDVQMPGIDGFETCRRLKADSRTADIPVIFITALSDNESIDTGFSLGAVDYITKPFREVEVLARVKTHLKLRNLNKNLEQEVKQRTADLRTALHQLRSSQMQLVQSEKMAALGNLIAGIAHEINNPIGFISGNINAAEEHLQDLLQALTLYQAAYPDPAPELVAALEDLDLEFIVEDFPKIVASMQFGISRISGIGVSLRTFSRTDAETKTVCDLHECIDSTLVILKYRLKANEKRPAIQVMKNYGDLPEIQCYPGQLNQVFMNIFANAIDAFEEANQGQSFVDIKANPNSLTIQTLIVRDQVQLQIQDNGCGMKPETVSRIFEQGFTTKEVGKGTGLGMAIAHQIIAEKHGGTIACTSEVGQGSTFKITLPL